MVTPFFNRLARLALVGLLCRPEFSTTDLIEHTSSDSFLLEQALMVPTGFVPPADPDSQADVRAVREITERIEKSSVKGPSFKNDVPLDLETSSQLIESLQPLLGDVVLSEVTLQNLRNALQEGLPSSMFQHQGLGTSVIRWGLFSHLYQELNPNELDDVRREAEHDVLFEAWNTEHPDTPFAEHFLKSRWVLFLSMLVAEDGHPEVVREWLGPYSRARLVEHQKNTPSRELTPENKYENAALLGDAIWDIVVRTEMVRQSEKINQKFMFSTGTMSAIVVRLFGKEWGGDITIDPSRELWRRATFLEAKVFEVYQAGGFRQVERTIMSWLRDVPDVLGPVDGPANRFIEQWSRHLLLESLGGQSARTPALRPVVSSDLSEYSRRQARLSVRESQVVVEAIESALSRPLNEDSRTRLLRALAKGLPDMIFDSLRGIGLATIQWHVLNYAATHWLGASRRDLISLISFRKDDLVLVPWNIANPNQKLPADVVMYRWAIFLIGLLVEEGDLSTVSEWLLPFSQKRLAEVLRGNSQQTQLDMQSADLIGVYAWNLIVQLEYVRQRKIDRAVVNVVSQLGSNDVRFAIERALSLQNVKALFYDYMKDPLHAETILVSWLQQVRDTLSESGSHVLPFVDRWSIHLRQSA